ncbi:MAG TPA: TIGR03118 family protein [Candidatus Dormibacteraeota bacterium]|nr:TIGR03118 family protein [Candidatus Dormibacteraeota bacterium]
MHRCFKATKLLSVAVVALAVGPSVSFAQHYNQKNLVSNLVMPDNPDKSKVTLDPNLKNPWGMTRSAGSPWWIGNNNSGTSSLYDGNGNPINIFPDPAGSVFDNFVIVPPPGFAKPGTQSAPTGVVFNGSPTDFILDKGTPAGKQALFIFATEDGTISGWNPGANVAAGAKPPSINPVLEVDNSDGGSTKGAVYKGATSADINGKKFLYVANFRTARVEVYDSNFKPVNLGEDAFDPDSEGDSDRHDGDDRGGVPRGFAPFNIQNIGGSLFVTYAKQDALRHDPVGGDGFGFVEIFTPAGKHIGHLQHGPWLNAPWGVVWTPRDFGKFSNSILVGNFRSGWIASFNGFTHKFEGFVQNPDNSLVFIDGIWSLTFGNNGTAGSSDTLFFTAGLNGEQDGLFGTLTPVPAEEDGSIE